jgi:hypothetical protein
MICVSVGNVDVRECMERLEGIELAEVRLDTMDVDPVSVRAIFSMPFASSPPADRTVRRRRKAHPLSKAMEAGTASSTWKRMQPPDSARR